MRIFAVDPSEVRMASRSGKGVRKGSKQVSRPSSGREARRPTAGGGTEGISSSRGRDAFPAYPRDIANPFEQESILSEGEEARPRKVPEARGEIRGKGGMRATTAEGREPRDSRGGGAAFADAPARLLKPEASARPARPLAIKRKKR